MITVAVAEKGVGILSLMKFFPGDENFRAALMELFGEMCHDDEQVLWLARRTRSLFKEWPGAHELRAVFCTKYKPRDGEQADSDAYPEGIPSESGNWERDNLEWKDPAKALPPGTLSLDSALATLVTDAANGLKRLPAPKRDPRAESNPNPNPRNAEQSLKASVAASSELSDTDKPEPVEEEKCST